MLTRLTQYMRMAYTISTQSTHKTCANLYNKLARLT